MFNPKQINPSGKRTIRSRQNQRHAKNKIKALGKVRLNNVTDTNNQNKYTRQLTSHNIISNKTL